MSSTKSSACEAIHGASANTTFGYLWNAPGVTITYGAEQPQVATVAVQNLFGYTNGVNVSITGNGSGTPFNVMQPTSFWNIMIKL